MIYYGTNGRDIIYAPDENNRIEMRAGDDSVTGGMLNDLVWLGDGNDALFDEYGDDRVYGGKGNDVIEVVGGDDKVWGDAGNDGISAEAFGPGSLDQLFGGAGADKIELFYNDGEGRGGAGPDHLISLGGQGRLYGEAGADRFEIYAGNAAFGFVSGGTEKDAFAIGLANDGFKVNHVYISDMAPGERLSVSSMEEGVSPTAPEVFDLLDTNNDHKLTVNDRPTAFGDVVYEASGPGIALHIGEDILTLHNVAAIADWQFV